MKPNLPFIQVLEVPLWERAFGSTRGGLRPRTINMKQSILGAALVVLTSLGSAEPAGAPSGPHDCERSNRAMLLSSKRQAEADFWLHVAQSLADPAGNAPFAIKNAYIEWSDAGALATSVFQAREKVCALFGHLDYTPR